MLQTIRHLLEMIRFSHTLFALPFALLAAVMAWTTPAADGAAVPFRWQDLLGILVCMVGARSAAMAFNRLADRQIDAENPRTKMRHLPAGTLSATLNGSGLQNGPDGVRLVRAENLIDALTYEGEIAGFPGTPGPADEAEQALSRCPESGAAPLRLAVPTPGVANTCT